MFLLLFFLRSSICRSPCSPSFSFFRCFVFSSSRSVCFLYRPRRFSFFFSLPWRIRLLCYFVLAVFPPALLTSLKYGYSPCVLSSFLRSWRWFFFFFSLLPFFRFRFGHHLIHPVFFLWVLCCLLGFGYCCDSFRILYDVNTSYVCILIRTYADLTFYFCLRYTICFSCCVYYLLFFIYLLVFLRR